MPKSEPVVRPAHANPRRMLSTASCAWGSARARRRRVARHRCRGRGAARKPHADGALCRENNFSSEARTRRLDTRARGRACDRPSPCTASRERRRNDLPFDDDAFDARERHLARRQRKREEASLHVKRLSVGRDDEIEMTHAREAHDDEHDERDEACERRR